MVGDRQAARLPELSTPAFVGREHEVTALRQAMSRPPAVVLVEAEPGGGKSRLVREFFASPAGRRHRMLVAVCPPFREALTLGPVVDAIRQCREDLSGLRLSALAGALRPLFPEWTDSLPQPPEPLADARAARHRLLRALAELIGALGVTGLVVEDVHWADAVTLELLVYLASHPQPQPPSLVVTYRPEEVPAASLLRRLSSRLPAGTTQVRIGLAPLDVAATAGMVSSMVRGGRISCEFAAFLHGRTGGVPLALEESVRLLRDRADLVRRDGEWVRRSRDHELQVSPTIRDSVRERMQRLHGSAQRLLAAAAVLGEAAPAHIVAEVAGLPARQAEAALSEAIASGLLCEDARARLRFRHVFLGQAVYEATSGAARRGLHLRAGQVLEAVDPAPLAQLTRHFREATQVAQWCRYAEQAAANAIASGDRTTAVVLLDEVLTAAELVPATRARLARQLANAALDPGEKLDDLHHRVARTLRTIIDSGGLEPRQQAQLRLLLGRLLGQQGDLTACQAELERAIPHLDHDPVQAARAMTYLGWPHVGTLPTEVHLRWLERAAALEPTVVSAVDRLALAIDRATGLLMLGEESGWQLAAELPAEGTGTELRQQLARGCLNIGFAAIVWGRYAEAHRQLEAGLKLADAEGYWRLRARLVVGQAEIDWFTGAWAELEQQAAALLDTEVVDPFVRMPAVRLMGRLHAARGARRPAEKHFAAALREAQQRSAVDDVMEPAAALGRLRLAERRIEEALQVTEDPMRTVAVKGIWIWATDIAPVRVEALIAAGRRTEAADLVAAYTRGLRGHPAPAAQAGLATCRALVAAAAGPADAVGLFARAARAWAQLPRPYDALLNRERQAHCLLATGRTEPALDLLHQVQRGLAELGARGDADRVTRQLREHGIEVSSPSPWRGGRRGYGIEPSPRELEVVRLVLAGKTNREIAQALHKSPRTVAGQLGSVMRKLGVSSRTELAVRVVEAGLIPDHT